MPLVLALLYRYYSLIFKYFRSFLITALAVVFISMFISVIENRIFFMDVNSDVGKKVDLT